MKLNVPPPFKLNGSFIELNRRQLVQIYPDGYMEPLRYAGHYIIELITNQQNTITRYHAITQMTRWILEDDSI